MGILTDLLLGFQENERAVRRTLPFFRSDGKPRHNSATFRDAMLRHYRQADQPRVPAPAKVTPNSIVLLLMLFKVIKSIEGITGLPAGTKLLLAANCLPFLKPDGFALPTFGLSPFMVWEHRQFYRLLTAGFLHADFNHMVSNATNLVISSNYLGRGLTRVQFAATAASLTLSSHSLYGKTAPSALLSNKQRKPVIPSNMGIMHDFEGMKCSCSLCSSAAHIILLKQLFAVLSSWVDCRWFGLWRQYFLEGAVGASGLCFAMQVVADHMRGGTVSVFGISGLEARAKFSCWISLAVTQFLVPQASFTGHLCGVLAGLVHVYIPKAVQEVRWRLAGQNGDQLVRSRRTAASRLALSQDRPVEFAGRRWPDCVVHAACFALAVLTRSLLRSRKKVTPLVWSF